MEKQTFPFPSVELWVHSPRLQWPSCSMAWENLFLGNNLCKTIYSMQQVLTSVNLCSMQQDKTKVITSCRGLRRESTMQTAHKSHRRHAWSSRELLWQLQLLAEYIHELRGNINSLIAHTTHFEPCVPLRSPSPCFGLSWTLVGNSFFLLLLSSQGKEDRSWIVS